MNELYADSEVSAAAEAVLANFHPPTNLKPSWHLNPGTVATAVIEVVAPAIAARATAAAEAKLAKIRELATEWAKAHQPAMPNDWIYGFDEGGRTAGEWLLEILNDEREISA